MDGIEQLTITLPADTAASIRDAVEDGEYASSSEVVREALRAWEIRRSLKLRERDLFRSEIERGLADLAADRVRPFDVARIVERGKASSPDRSRSD